MSTSDMPWPATRSADDDVMVAARSDVPVLITAECRHERLGCARAIHAQSARRRAPFVEFDCGSRGASEDVARALRNRFEDSSSGTLFLEGVEMMSNGVQAELFRVLEDISRGGGASFPNRTGHPRVISGASGSLLTAIAAGAFDEGLFYRLNVLHLDLTCGEAVRVARPQSARHRDHV